MAAPANRSGGGGGGAYGGGGGGGGGPGRRAERSKRGLDDGDSKESDPDYVLTESEDSDDGKRHSARKQEAPTAKRRRSNVGMMRQEQAEYTPPFTDDITVSFGKHEWTVSDVALPLVDGRRLLIAVTDEESLSVRLFSGKGARRLHPGRHQIENLDVIVVRMGNGGFVLGKPHFVWSSRSPSSDSVNWPRALAHAAADIVGRARGAGKCETFFIDAGASDAQSIERNLNRIFNHAGSTVFVDQEDHPYLFALNQLHDFFQPVVMAHFDYRVATSTVYVGDTPPSAFDQIIHVRQSASAIDQLRGLLRLLSTTPENEEPKIDEAIEDYEARMLVMAGRASGGVYAARNVKLVMLGDGNSGKTFLLTRRLNPALRGDNEDNSDTTRTTAPRVLQPFFMPTGDNGAPSVEEVRVDALPPGVRPPRLQLRWLARDVPGQPEHFATTSLFATSVCSVMLLTVRACWCEVKVRDAATESHFASSCRSRGGWWRGHVRRQFERWLSTVEATRRKARASLGGGTAVVAVVVTHADTWMQQHFGQAPDGGSGVEALRDAVGEQFHRVVQGEGISLKGMRFVARTSRGDHDARVTTAAASELHRAQDAVFVSVRPTAAGAAPSPGNAHASEVDEMDLLRAGLVCAGREVLRPFVERVGGLPVVVDKLRERSCDKYIKGGKLLMDLDTFQADVVSSLRMGQLSAPPRRRRAAAAATMIRTASVPVQAAGAAAGMAVQRSASGAPGAAAAAAAAAGALPPPRARPGGMLSRYDSVSDESAVAVSVIGMLDAAGYVMELPACPPSVPTAVVLLDIAAASKLVERVVVPPDRSGVVDRSRVVYESDDDLKRRAGLANDDEVRALVALGVLVRIRSSSSSGGTSLLVPSLLKRQVAPAAAWLKRLEDLGAAGYDTVTGHHFLTGAAAVAGWRLRRSGNRALPAGFFHRLGLAVLAVSAELGAEVQVALVSSGSTVLRVSSRKHGREGGVDALLVLSHSADSLGLVDVCAVASSREGADAVLRHAVMHLVRGELDSRWPGVRLVAAEKPHCTRCLREWLRGAVAGTLTFDVGSSPASVFGGSDGSCSCKAAARVVAEAEDSLKPGLDEDVRGRVLDAVKRGAGVAAGAGVWRLQSNDGTSSAAGEEWRKQGMRASGSDLWEEPWWIERAARRAYSVCRLLADNTSGTAFVLSDGVLVTALHVVWDHLFKTIEVDDWGSKESCPYTGRATLVRSNSVSLVAEFNYRKEFREVRVADGTARVEERNAAASTLRVPISGFRSGNASGEFVAAECFCVGPLDVCFVRLATGVATDTNEYTWRRGQERSLPDAYRVPLPRPAENTVREHVDGLPAAAGTRVPVSIVHHPHGEEQYITMRQSHVHNEESSKHGASMMVHTAPTTKGSSGAPVFDTSWLVVAVNLASVNEEKEYEDKVNHIVKDSVTPQNLASFLDDAVARVLKADPEFFQMPNDKSRDLLAAAVRHYLLKNKGLTVSQVSVVASEGAVDAALAEEREEEPDRTVMDLFNDSVEHNAPPVTFDDVDGSTRTIRKLKLRTTLFGHAKQLFTTLSSG